MILYSDRLYLTAGNNSCFNLYYFYSFPYSVEALAVFEPSYAQMFNCCNNVRSGSMPTPPDVCCLTNRTIFSRSVLDLLSTDCISDTVVWGGGGVCVGGCLSCCNDTHRYTVCVLQGNTEVIFGTVIPTVDSTHGLIHFTCPLREHTLLRIQMFCILCNNLACRISYSLTHENNITIHLYFTAAGEHVNRLLRRIFGAKDEVKGECRKLHSEELHHLYSPPNMLRVTNSR
jgi:hypothetical protein